MRGQSSVAVVFAAVPLLCLFAGSAAAQTYPSKPLTIVVPVAAGGGMDFLMRTMAPPVSERLSQPVLVENRPGGDGNIGHAFVAKAPPDGYTFVALLPTLAYLHAAGEHLNTPGYFKVTD